MRILRKGEKGFTLIELLIVVAIIGVLAAVVIPNVGRFLGRGEEEARRTEFHNIASAVIAMMTDNNISVIPAPATSATNWLGDDTTTAGTLEGFPDSTTLIAAKGYTGLGTPKAGYMLYQHDKIGTDTTTFTTVNYVNMVKTKYYYTAEADGTVHQWPAAGATGAQTEYKF